MTGVTSNNFMQWHHKAEALQSELPLIDTETSVNDTNIIGQLVHFYSTHILSNNGIFPDDLSEFLDASDEEFVSLLTERLTQEDPLGRFAPQYMKRKAENIQSTYWMSFHHLAVSLIEESQARAAVYKRQGKEITFKGIVSEILAQQLMAYEYLNSIARNIEEQNFATLSSEEISRNEELLSVVSKKLKQSASRLNIPFDTSAEDIHSNITKTWGMLTTNQTLITPDFNYRTHSMRVPGASRSLFPYPHLPMFAHSSPVADYITYAEVPQASRITSEDNLSFAFLNAVHFNPKTGEGFIVEHPHYMHSTNMMMLASEVPEAFNAVFGSAKESKQNHDLLHHMLQVFGEHFQIHHSSAPLSKNGYSQNYTAFGRDMRAYRDTYELTAVAGQADIYSFRYPDGSKPKFFQDEVNLMRKTYGGIQSVKQHLLNAGRDAEAQRFTDYGCRAILGMYSFIFAPDTPEREELDHNINTLSPSPVDVSLHSIVSFLDAQGLLDISLQEKLNTIKAVLNDTPDAHRLPNVVRFKNSSDDVSDKKHAEYVSGAFYSILPFCKTKQINDFYKTAQPNRQYPEAEFGSEILVSMLNEMDLLQEASAFPIQLSGMNSVRWVLLGSNNKAGIKGLAEKGHRMDAAQFGKDAQASVFDMIVMQEHAIGTDQDIYNNRILANQYSQQAAHALLSLFSFTHAQEENYLPEIISNAYKSGENSERIGQTITIIDDLIDGIFNDKISPLSSEQESTFSFLKHIVEEQDINPDMQEKSLQQIHEAIAHYQRISNLFNSPRVHPIKFSTQRSPSELILN